MRILQISDEVLPGTDLVYLRGRVIIDYHPVSLYEYEYDVVFRKKLSYSYFTRIKIRVYTTLYQYDLVCIRPEKIQ